MNIRVARKILTRRRSKLADRPSRQEVKAYRYVLNHWHRWCFPDEYFSFENNDVAHQDNRALDSYHNRYQWQM